MPSPTHSAPAVGAPADWESALAACHSSYPTFVPSAESIRRVLLAHQSARASQPPELAAPDFNELYLAAGCVDGNGEAIRLFDERYITPLFSRLRRMRLAHSSIADILQDLRERLLVAAEGELPVLCRYAGGGHLGGLVQVAATRLAINTSRKHAREVGDTDDLLAAPACAESQELASLRRQCSREFKEAFSAALADLEVRERNILRLRYLDGLTVDQIASLSSAHRTTASRWFSSIRDRLWHTTRQHLASRLDLRNSEVASLIRAVESDIDLSLSRLLKNASSGGEEDAQ